MLGTELKPEGFFSDGYVPSDIGIGGDDYIDFIYCLECGQIQDEFPLTITSIEC
jgi:hypothetical protein